jgi:hypothetical protein
MKPLLLTLAILTLAGCQSLGLAPAQTLDQKLAYVAGAVTTVQQSTTTALQAGQITSAQATNLNNLSLNVLSIVTTGRSLEASNASGAANDLALAQTALTSLQTYLKAAGVK